MKSRRVVLAVEIEGTVPDAHDLYWELQDVGRRGWAVRDVKILDDGIERRPPNWATKSSIVAWCKTCGNFTTSDLDELDAHVGACVGGQPRPGVLDVECPQCHAGPGLRCRTDTDAINYSPHVARWRASR